MSENKYFESNFGKQPFLLKHNAEQQEKIMDKQLQTFISNVKQLEDAEKSSLKRITALKEAKLDDEAEKEIANYNKILEAKLSAEQEYAKQKVLAQQQAEKTAQIYEINQFRKLSAVKKREYSKNIADELKLNISASQQRVANLNAENKELEKAARRAHAAMKSAKTEEERQKYEDEKKTARARIATNKQVIRETSDNVSALQQKQALAQQNASKFSKLELTNKDSRKDFVETKLRIEDKQNAYGQATLKLSDAEERKAAALAKQATLEEKIKRARELGYTKQLETLAAEQEENELELKNSELALDQAAAEKTKAESELAQADALMRIYEQIDSLVESVLGKEVIDKAIDDLYKDGAKYTGLLKGTRNELGIFYDSWQTVTEDVTDLVGFSATISSRAVIEKMKTLLEQHGITYNLEFRSLMETLAGDIASTFSATNDSLLRLIRLQQADTTAARLGMETTLIELFNKLFYDTSYLRGASDNITAAILDSSAMLDRNASLQYEYTLQKWLGSLYSIGMSEQAITKIAEGINYLGTGNASKLSSSSDLQTILVMSANRAGLSYTDLLTSGLNPTETNDLLRSIIEYLAEIARSQENNVVKSAYADLFGMSVMDLNTFANLTDAEIKNLYNQSVTYNSLVKEVDKSMSTLWTKKPLTDLVNTLIDNTTLSVAANIASNPLTYGMWKALGVLEKVVGSIDIPGILGMGTGIATMDILNVAQTGMVGISFVGQLLESLGSLSGGLGNIVPLTWHFRDYNPRGSALSQLLTSAEGSILSLSSKLSSIGSTSSEDIESVMMEDAEKKGTDALEKIQNEELQNVSGMEERIWNALEDDQGNTVIKLLKGLSLAAPDDSGGEPPEEKLDVSGNASSNETNNSESASGNSGGGSASSSQGTSALEKIQDSEIYNKIYDSITQGESINVLTVLQEISDKLALDRVFYTGITSTSSETLSGSIQDMSAHIHNSHFHNTHVSAGITSADKETSNNNNVVSKGELLNKQYSENMQEIIAAAVETAIRNISGYSTGTGLPVTVTNLNNYGGGF